jgi:hypothetical protein
MDRMTRNYRPYPQQPVQYAPLPSRTASRWWRPLTRWWGILGVIIFIGLVMRLIDVTGFPRSLRHAPVSRDHAMPAVQLEQSLQRSQ